MLPSHVYGGDGHVWGGGMPRRSRRGFTGVFERYVVAAGSGGVVCFLICHKLWPTMCVFDSN